MSPGEKNDPYHMIFGLSRAEDERSLADFLSLFADSRLTSVLIPRMADDEISQTVDLLSRIMRNNLSEKEYHTLFLGRTE